MNGSDEPHRHRARRDLEQQISAKESRKLRARETQFRTTWFGLGMFGLVGWSVAVPALLGVAMGLWVDTHWPSRFSWTLMLLVFGVAMGCLNAWRWVVRESQVEDDKE